MKCQLMTLLVQKCEHKNNEQGLINNLKHSLFTSLHSITK